MSGLVQSLGTEWGLFRYYWIVAKLSLTVVATMVLMLLLTTTVLSVYKPWGRIGSARAASGR